MLSVTHRLLCEEPRGVPVGADVGQAAPALEVGRHGAQAGTRLPALLRGALLEQIHLYPDITYITTD